MPDFIKSKEFWLLVATIAYPVISRIVPEDSIISAVEFQNILLGAVSLIIGIDIRSNRVEAPK